MAQTYDIAVVGASSLVGEHLVELLATRHFPVGHIFALEVDADEELDVSFGGETLDLENLVGFDFSRVQLVFFVTDDANVAAMYAPQAVEAGCVVIDGTGYFAADREVPLVMSTINPHAVADYLLTGMVASPHPMTLAVLTTLKPLHDAATISRVNIATYQAVADIGRAGVDELARQTAQLLNGRPVEPNIYAKQMAFNLLPQVGAFGLYGYTDEEMALVQETQRIFEDDRIQVIPTAVRVPVFFGSAAAVHVELLDELSPSSAVQLWSGVTGIEVLDEPNMPDYATSVNDAAANDGIYISRVREMLASPGGLNFWLVTDNVRNGVALNSVQIAELLVRDYL
ncbi:MAG: hypothetical protein RI964_190 [Pseudomonadota bacterium]|jgi:aspartate-semialdehyde dehydrogenase